MSEQTESALRQSLDTIDSMRRRVLMGGWLAVIVTLGAYARFYYVARTAHDLGTLVGSALTALTCLTAWASFAVILIVVRMSARILRAIDLALK